MKVTDVKTYIAGNPWKNWVFTRVETDEGEHGVGEAIDRRGVLAAGIDERSPHERVIRAVGEVHRIQHEETGHDSTL